MIWQLFLIGYLILATAGFLVRRHLAVALTKHNRLVHGFFFLCVLYPTGILLAFMFPGDLDIGWQNMLFLLIGSAIFPIQNMLAYRSNKDVDAGLYTILSNLTPIVTIIAATILLHEGLNAQQLLGAAIIIGSAFVATLPKIFNRTITKTRGLGIALLGIVLLGLVVVFERWMLTRIDLAAYFVYGWGAQTMWMMIVAWPERKYVRILKEKKNFRPVLAYALASAFKSVFFIAALKYGGNASVVTAFASFVCVLVVVAAFFFLKERDHLWYKAGAAFAGVTGLIILNT